MGGQETVVRRKEDDDKLHSEPSPLGRSRSYLGLIGEAVAV